MNRPYLLWYIDETVERIRNAGKKGKEQYINDLHDHLGLIIPLLYEHPDFKQLEEETLNALDEIDDLYYELIDDEEDKNSVIPLIKEQIYRIEEQSSMIEPFLDKLRPVDLLRFSEYYMEEVVKETASFEPLYVDLFKDAMDFFANMDKSTIDTTVKQVYSDAYRLGLGELEFYNKEIEQAKEKGFTVKNDIQKTFLTYFWKEFFGYEEAFLKGDVEFYSALVQYMEDGDKAHLDRAYDAAVEADRNLLRNNIIKNRFKKLGEITEEDITDVEYPFIYEPGLKEHINGINRKSEILSFLPFFNVLPGEDIEKLSRKIKLKKYVKDDVIFTEGSRADEVYIIKTGDVLVYNNMKTFATLTKGDMFGEIGVISGNTRSLSAAVMSPVSEIYVITKEHFINMLEKYPSLGINLSKVLCRRIDMATKNLTASMNDNYLYNRDKSELANMRKKIDIISVNPFFNILSKEHLERISSRIKLKRYDKGAVLFNEGDMADDFYIIKSGRISLYYNKNQALREFRTLDKGDILGEMAVISDTRRSLSASVISDRAELYVISKDNFLYLLNHYPELNLNMAKILCHRINILTQRMSGIMGKTVTPTMPVQTNK
ncbi:MAG: cyclic nucleotide-binding domain-containing protein [Candidatus Eremiobacterota bacterium]